MSQDNPVLEIKTIPFSQIATVWDIELWPGRLSPIESSSDMMFMGGKRYYGDSEKSFIGGFVNGQLVAVNSVHKTEPYLARSRGLWVHPNYRGQRFAQKILAETCDRAVKMGAHSIWTFPRQSSISAYQEAGFIRVSGWLDDGEFGPNCYAIRRIVDVIY